MIEKFLKIPLQQRLALLALVVAAIGLIFYFFIYSSAVEEEAQLKNRTKRLRIRHDELTQNRNKYRSKDLVKQIKGLRKRLQQINEILPSSEESDTFLASIESDARSAQLKIENTQRMSREYEANFARLPIRTEVKGTFTALITFLRKLSDRSGREGQMKRIVNVSKIDIKPKGTQLVDGKKVPLLKSRFISNTYMLVEGSRRGKRRRRRR